VSNSLSCLLRVARGWLFSDVPVPDSSFAYYRTGTFEIQGKLKKEIDESNAHKKRETGTLF
jgi:hypothetical protein